MRTVLLGVLTCGLGFAGVEEKVTVTHDKQSTASGWANIRTGKTVADTNDKSWISAYTKVHVWAVMKGKIENEVTTKAEVRLQDKEGGPNTALFSLTFTGAAQGSAKGKYSVLKKGKVTSTNTLSYEILRLDDDGTALIDSNSIKTEAKSNDKDEDLATNSFTKPYLVWTHFNSVATVTATVSSKTTIDVSDPSATGEMEGKIKCAWTHAVIEDQDTVKVTNSKSTLGGGVTVSGPISTGGSVTTPGSISTGGGTTASGPISTDPGDPSRYYKTTFDEEVTGWTFTASSTADPKVEWKVRDQVLSYNNGTSYDDGAANSGTARSPKVDISSTLRPVVRFRCSWDAEDFSDVDLRQLRIYSEGVTTPVYTETFNSAKCGPANTWHEHELELDRNWGIIQVEFSFDTVDDQQNQFKGWFLDDFTVEDDPSTTAAPTPALSPTPTAQGDDAKDGGCGGSVVGAPLGSALFIGLVFLGLVSRRSWVR